MRLQFAHVTCPFLCLQRQVAKLVNGLYYYWSLLRNNNTVINVQMLTSSCGSRCFSAFTRALTVGFFPPDLPFFSRPGCLGSIMKNRVK